MSGDRERVADTTAKPGAGVTQTSGAPPVSAKLTQAPAWSAPPAGGWLGLLPAVKGGTMVNLGFGGDPKTQQSWGQIKNLKGSGNDPILIYTLAVPQTGPNPAIDAQVASIEAFRASVPATQLGRAQNNVGWHHDPRHGAKGLTASTSAYNDWFDRTLAGAAPPGIDAKLWQIYQQIVPFEGKPTEVTTFDNTLSIGAGFSTAGGGPQMILMKILEALPEVREVFLRAGVSVSPDPVSKLADVKVVDTANKWILSGKDAINYLETNRDLLTLIVNTLEGSQPVAGSTVVNPAEADKQRLTALVAQFNVFSEGTLVHISDPRKDPVTGAAAPAVVDWPPVERLMAVHARHASGNFDYSFWDSHPHGSPAEVAEQIYLNASETLADTIIENATLGQFAFGPARPQYRRDKDEVPKYQRRIKELKKASIDAWKKSEAADKSAQDANAALDKAEAAVKEAKSKVEDADAKIQAADDAGGGSATPAATKARKAAELLKKAAEATKKKADAALTKAKATQKKKLDESTARREEADAAADASLRAPGEARDFARKAAIEEADFLDRRSEIAKTAAEIAKGRAAAAAKTVEVARSQVVKDREAAADLEKAAKAAEQDQKDAAKDLRGKQGDEKLAAKEALTEKSKAAANARTAARAAAAKITTDAAKIAPAVAAQARADDALKKARSHADDIAAKAAASRAAVPSDEEPFPTTSAAPIPETEVPQ